MSGEPDEDDITSAFWVSVLKHLMPSSCLLAYIANNILFPSVAVLDGTDNNKGEWSYSPAWFSAEDKGNKTNSSASANTHTHTPAKGLNTALSGDTSLTPVSFPPPVTNHPSLSLLSAEAPDPTSNPAVASSPTQVADSSVLPTTPSVPLVGPPPLEGPNFPPVQAPSIPPPAAEAIVASLPPTNSPVEISSPPPSSPAPSMPPTQDSYCPAATHFNRFSSGPNYIPQSGYDPVGPGLSAQVGNRSHEMVGKFHNFVSQQSNLSITIVQQQN